MKIKTIGLLTILLVILLSQTSCLTMAVSKKVNQSYQIGKIKSATLSKDSILKVNLELDSKRKGGREVNFELDLNQVLSATVPQKELKTKKAKPKGAKNYFLSPPKQYSTLQVSLYPKAVKKGHIKNDGEKVHIGIQTSGKDLDLNLENTRLMLRNTATEKTQNPTNPKLYDKIDKLEIALPRKTILAYKLLYIATVPLDIASVPILIVVGTGVIIHYQIKRARKRRERRKKKTIQNE